MSQTNNKAPEISKADIALFKGFQKSPIFFTEKVFHLVPQPIKPEFFELVNGLVDSDRSKEVRESHFQPFVKGKHLTWQQWLLFRAVERAIAGQAKRRISVVSGHGTGKSCSISLLILWFLFCHKDAQIPCTAPTSNQMHDILWKEVSIWLKKMPAQIQEKFTWSSEYIRVNESPESWFARAKTASKENSEALAGVHGDHVMVLVDEASGVYDEIYNTAEGSLTGENVLVILISNGTRLVGYFYDTHHGDSQNWQNLAFNAEESPIVEDGFIERIATKHGTDSDEYSIRVKGGFGAEEGIDDQGYVPLLVEADLRKASGTDLNGRIKLGIDPAGDGGDAMAQVGRDAYRAKVLSLEKVSTPKSIARIAVGLMKAHGITGDDVAADNFGIGANVAQEVALANPAEPIRIEGVNVGDDAEEKDRFLNRRAELAWRMREWIKKGGEIVDLDNMREELLSLRYRRTAGGIARIQLMDKRTMKKLGLNHGKSPNRVDALMLTFNRGDEVITVYKQAEHETISSYEG